jgi:hypothetical protein
MGSPIFTDTQAAGLLFGLMLRLAADTM